MKLRPLYRLMTVFFAFALIAAACGDDDDGATTTTAPPADEPAPAPADEPAGIPDNPDEGVESDVIKIGFMGDLTGPTASAQVVGLHGVESGVECINEGGGVHNRQFELVIEDDQFSAETGVINFTKLVEDENVLMILSGGGTHIMEAMIPDVEAAGIAEVGALTTSDAMVASPNFFTNTPHYGDQADVIIREMAERVGGPENLVVYGISFGVNSGREFAAYSKQTVENAGGTYVGTSYMEPAAIEATAQMIELQQAVEDSGVNVVTLHASETGGAIMVQGMVDAGLTDLDVGAIHGMAAIPFFENIPEVIWDRVFTVHGFLPANIDFEGAAEMQRCADLAGYGDEWTHPLFSNGYLNTLIAKQAVQRAGDDSGELSRASVLTALRGTFDAQGIACDIDWSAVSHSPCAMAFGFGDDGQLKALNTFDFYATALDLEYDVEIPEG